MIGMKVCQKERERVRKKMYDVPVLVFGANDRYITGVHYR